MKILILLILPTIVEMVVDFSTMNDAEFDSLTYYQLLNISSLATFDEIKRAYKQAAIKYHPDRNHNNPKAGPRFARIVKAYEILIDSFLRRRYDLEGQLDMDDETSSGLKQEHLGDNGIYDNVDEILTFKYGNFAPSVINSNDYWLINFNSPHCSHCLEISQMYQQLAAEFYNVIGIGSVNCFVDNQACADQGVYNYPILKLYPTGVIFDESKTEMNYQNLKTFILQNLDNNINCFTPETLENYKNSMSKNKPMILMATLIDPNNETMENLIKIYTAFKSFDLEVGYLKCELFPKENEFCNEINSGENESYFYFPAGINDAHNFKILDNVRITSLLGILQDIIPKIKILDNKEINDVLSRTENGVSSQTLILFFKSNSYWQHQIEVGKILKLLAPLVKIVGIDCSKTIFCYEHNIHRFPSVALIKSSGIEIHYGNFFSREILNFYTLVSGTDVSALSDLTIPSLERLDSDFNTTFIVYLFNSKCQPCIYKIWEFRRFANEINDPSKSITFFTLDCYFYYHICYKYSVTQGFPYVKYQKNKNIELTNHFSIAEDIHEFIKDINIEYVHDLTPETFNTMVVNRDAGSLWFVDFYNSACSLCQHLLPTITKLSKKFQDKVNFGKIKCDLFPTFCVEQSVQYYPTLRMFSEKGIYPNSYIEYNGWTHYHPLDQFIHTFLPSAIIPIDPTNFNQVFFSDKTNTWVIDFYALWCSPCMNFMPILENLAKQMSTENLKFGKIECSVNKNLCDQFPIQYYPTLLLFQSGNKVFQLKRT